MQKDFDRWNTIKQATDGLDDSGRPFFHEGDVWWIRLGKNIGYEIDGKAANFARPVIVLRKYNKHSFLALPLTTSTKSNAWKLPVGMVAGKPAFAVMSQLRNIDSRRLYQKLSALSAETLRIVRKETFRMNAGERL